MPWTPLVETTQLAKKYSRFFQIKPFEKSSTRYSIKFSFINIVAGVRQFHCSTSEVGNYFLRRAAYEKILKNFEGEGRTSADVQFSTQMQVKSKIKEKKKSESRPQMSNFPLKRK